MEEFETIVERKKELTDLEAIRAFRNDKYIVETEIG